MAHIILFEHANFHGAHKHVFDWEPNLNADDDDFFNDKTSSLVVVEDNWKTFINAGFKDPYPPILGLGLYPKVSTVGIKNDDMSSLQWTRESPTIVGVPLNNHVILFEHANFRGAHKHVFTAEPNLNADDDDFFNDKTSSLAVLKGNWAFYSNAGLHSQDQYPPILGPGGYPFVGSVQIVNDQMSALQPVDSRPTVQNPLFVDQGVVLFEHINFHGAHKHVVARESNLNASEDDFFNDKVSSFVVRDREWIFHPDSNFQGNYPVAPLPGQYSNVTDVGIKNDDISSLEPVV
ncbi:MAG: beta/gamma crystallin-related protein [Pseudonocardiaceae bacterium]